MQEAQSHRQRLHIRRESGPTETNLNDSIDNDVNDAGAIDENADKQSDDVEQSLQSDVRDADPTESNTSSGSKASKDAAKGNSKSALTQSQWGMMVLSFSHDSTYVREDMTRADVLKLARRTLLNVSALSDSRAGPTQGAGTTGWDAMGASRIPSHVRSGVAGASGSDMMYAVGTRVPTGPRRLQARDLRVLDPELGVATDPVIMARLDAIIVMIHPIRAVILVDKCIVFLNDGADAEVRDSIWVTAFA